MKGRRQRMRERRDQLEAMLATGQARLERARSRSLVVDTMVGVVQRERPVAVGILAGSLAFRLFALMIPLTYVLVAGLGFAAQASAEEAQPQVGDRLGDLLVASVAAATRTSSWAARAGRARPSSLRNTPTSSISRRRHRRPCRRHTGEFGPPARPWDATRRTSSTRR